MPALEYLEGSRPRYLYTSGRPNRCNPGGVECLYFSETERVANIEYRRVFAGTSAVDEPKLTFIAEVDLKRVVDLEKPDVLKVLDLATADLFEFWRGAPSPTQLQKLGAAISTQRFASAIRYPSDACRRVGAKGWNVAIFPQAIMAPSWLRIRGRSGKPLEELP